VGRNLASANRDSRKSENHKKNDAVSRCLNPTSCGRFFSEIPCYRKKKSLLFEIFSLLIFAGNSPRSGCSTAASCCEIASQSPKNVKFPVSREFAWRRVRSALRRQPVLSPNIKHVWSFRFFHSERSHLAHSERMLPIGSPANEHVSSELQRAFEARFSWRTRHNSPWCDAPTTHGLDPL
jgi:hypothetical protein